jgi:hypothetical protein
MPSIVFTNFDGESLEIDLSKTNKQTKNNVQNKTNRRD